MTDPTGTAVLRRAFQADGNRRLGRVRSLTHTILVEHDLMHARNDPLAQFLPHPGHRLAAFTEWFARTVDQQLLAGGWWEKYLHRAWQSGITAGGELVRSLPPSGHAPVPAVYSELARRELAGIAAALVQQVSRQAGFAGITKQKPQMMYRQVLAVMQKVGASRLKTFANFMTVKLHNAARLEHFRAVGITRVGIVPERLQLAKPSRFLKHDHATLHDQSAKRKLAELTAAAEELLRRQRRQREEEEAQRQAELEAYKARLEAEISAQMQGVLIGSTQPTEELVAALAKAQAGAEEEVAAAKAATAAREEVAAAAWEEVLAARKEARAAEYAATRAAKTAEKEEATPAEEARAEKTRTASVEAQAEAVKTEAKAVTSLTVGRPRPSPTSSEIGKATTAYEKLSELEQVNVLTAGDDLVCFECEDISNSGPYSIDEALGLIPAHPNCRCAFVPALDEATNRELEEAAAE